uniref:WLM domain-containing protein n=1 Tax=viral metagenome TaxID=1070528 RepID=A0A6C0BXC5_9ZZZZ
MTTPEYMLIVIGLIACIYIYHTSEYSQLKCIISNVDGNKYCVRERDKLELAADRLATVNTRMKKVVEHCGGSYKNQDNVKRLVKGYNPKKIYETLPTSKYTAYSENKGEKLAFCLDTEKTKGTLIDMNTLTFVALHGLAHVATLSVGHTEEFWNNFKFLLQEAKKIGIYDPVNYKKEPARYCGMNIDDNPYYEL